MTLSTLLMPTRLVECATWRCRLDSSTVSPSTNPNVPIPAPARYAAAGQPSPPAPTRRTLALRRLSCPVMDVQYNTYQAIMRSVPWSPKLGTIICRLYRRYSSSPRGHRQAGALSSLLGASSLFSASAKASCDLRSASSVSRSAMSLRKRSISSMMTLT